MAYRFGEFVLEPEARRLRRGDTTVPLSPRYFDALVLLVGEAGRVVGKDRLLDEVWAGVPVTDEALTQCVKTLRRELGDSASSPRFIETAPKHGYRFVAPVEAVAFGAAIAPTPTNVRSIADAATRSGPLGSSERDALVRFGLAGTAGAAVAGLAGGLVYGAGASAGSSLGAASVLTVLVCLNLLAGLIGGAGVAFGMAAGRTWLGGPTVGLMLGGGLGGLIAGAVTKLVALDVFSLLFGAAPTGMTGGAEGLALGAAVAAGAVLAERLSTLKRAPIVGAAVAGGLAGIAITALGGRLMGGSLEHLSATYEGSRLQLGGLGALFGSEGFGRTGQITLAALEGLVFGACVIGAVVLAGVWTRLRETERDSAGVLARQKTGL